MCFPVRDIADRETFLENKESTIMDVLIGFFIILIALFVISLIFTGGGLLGWVLEGIAKALGLLLEGWGKLFSNAIGCLVWIFLAILGLVALCS